MSALLPKADIESFVRFVPKPDLCTAAKATLFDQATLIVTPLSSGNLEALAKGEANAASKDLLNLTLMR